MKFISLKKKSKKLINGHYLVNLLFIEKIF